MKRLKLVIKFLPFYLLVAMTATACKGAAPQVVDSKKTQFIFLSDDEYRQKNWQERTLYISSLPLEVESARKDLLYYAIFLGIKDKNNHVIIAALDKIRAMKLESARNLLVFQLRNPDPMVRWHALLALSELQPDPEDLKYLTPLFKDREWLVREAAYRTLRNYANEKVQKKLFFPILFNLAESNPAVLKELYRTLKWYDDKRVFSYIFQRSYNTRNDIELIFILRELSSYKTNSVYKRYKYLSESHKNPVVRNEARHLLQTMTD